MNERGRIGKKIREIREKKGLTQESLSELTGMTRTTISKIEAGKFNASVDLLGKILSALDAELDIKEL